MALLFDIPYELIGYESHGLAVSTLERAKAAIGVALDESEFDSCGYRIFGIARDIVLIGEGKLVPLTANIYPESPGEDDGHILP